MKTVNRFLGILLSIAMIFSMCSVFAVQPAFAAESNTIEFAGGTGTEADPYLILNKAHLNNVRKYLNAHFKLMCDITFTEADFSNGGAFSNGWTPIGNSSNPFKGTLDGNNHSIKNLRVETSGYVGLFGYLKGGTIKNLKMIDSNISTSDSFAGGIVGYIHTKGVVENCYNSGTITSTGTGAGGIAGGSYGVIRNCYNEGPVTCISAKGDKDVYVGGIVGCAWDSGAVIDYCRNSGTVKLEISSGYKNGYAGGIIGTSLHGTVRFCYNTGDVSSIVSVSLIEAIAGGIAGDLSFCTVSCCYNSGNVTAISKSRSPYDVYAGGIVGVQFYGTTENCYNTGGVEANTSVASDKLVCAGGIVGFIDGNPSEMVVQPCYNVGKISSNRSKSSVGGIIGYSDYFNSTPYENSYYLDSSAPQGAGHGSTKIHSKVTIEQMLQQETFSGFDFDTVWTMSGHSTYQLPKLQGLEMVSSYEGDLNSIKVICPPSKVLYTEGSDEKLDLSNGKLTLYYTSGFTKTIDLSEATVTGFDTAKVGEQKLKVAYGGKETTFSIFISAVKTFSSGTGTESDPFLIKTKVHLNNVRNYLNAHYKLVEDIKFADADFTNGGVFYNSGTGWIPIGPFTGNFDGNGCVIDNMHINIDGRYSSDTVYAGLFGESSGVIENLGMTNSEIVIYFGRYAYVGGIVGSSSGIIRNCYNTGSIIAETKATDPNAGIGGIVGELVVRDGAVIVSDCYNAGTISSGQTSHSLGYGGIVGCSSSVYYGDYDITVKNCYNVGNFNSPYCAGIIGSGSPNQFQNCYYLNNTYVGTGEKPVSCTEEQMKLHATFAGFDFDSVWFIDPYGQYNYPQLFCNTQTEIKSVEFVSPGKNFTVLEGVPSVLDGFTATVTYADGSSSSGEVTTDMLYGFDINSVGSQVVTTKIGSFTSEKITVTVIEKSLAAISVKTEWTKLTYVQGQSLSGQLLLTYNNGTSESIDLSRAECIFDKTAVGVVSVKVKYKNLETSFDVTVKPRVVSAASLTPPTISVLVEGAELDLSGGYWIVVFESDDNYSEKIPLTSEMISGFDNTKTGVQVVTVTYDNYFDTFAVNIIAKTLTSISVTKNPSKLTYLEGETFDKAGMVVTAYYNNNTSAVITDYTVSGYSSTVGTKTVTVSYGGKTATFTVTVKSRVPSSITSSKFTVSGGNISKIPAGTTVSALLAGINEGAYCKVYKGNSEVSGSAVVGTGMVVKLLDGNTVKASYTVVVTGDTNGDGNITITDMIAIKAHILKKTLLSGAAAKAADTNGDNSISITDFIQVKAKILGKGTITAR